MNMRYNYFYVLSLFMFSTLFLPFAGHAKTVYHQDLLPVVPRIMGMGNGFTAQASGLHSLWSNPAGLAKRYVNHFEQDYEVTALSFTIWSEPYLDRVTELFANFIDKDIDKGLVVLNTTGIALGMPISGGYLVHGHWGSLGLGLINMFDADVYTPNALLDIQAVMVEQAQLMVGYAYQFHISGFLLRLGATVRPLFRSHNTLEGDEVTVSILRGGDTSKAIESMEGFHGFAIAQDLGLQIEWEGVSFGADIHNIYTPLFYTKSKTTQFFSGSVSGSAPNDFFVMPLYINLGFAYNMNIVSLSWLESYFDFTIYLQFTDPFYLASIDTEEKVDFVSRIHTGIEFDILKPFIKIQFGLNKGTPTFGIGFDIWYFDIAFAFYTQESGLYLRERTTPGIAIEVAFRW